MLPKGKTADGLKYSLNQEKYLKVFLDHPDVPIDNSASERSIRTFCLGKKNWMFHNTANGAHSSALVYSISETAKLNNLRPYYYFKYILTELPKHCDEKGNIDPAELDYDDNSVCNRRSSSDYGNFDNGVHYLINHSL